MTDASSRSCFTCSHVPIRAPFVHCGSNVGMDRERHVEVLGRGEHGIVVGMAERAAVVRERRDVRAARRRRRPRVPARARPRPDRSTTDAPSASGAGSPNRTRRSTGCRRGCTPGSAPHRRARLPTTSRSSCRARPRRCLPRRAPRCVPRDPCCRTAPRSCTCASGSSCIERRSGSPIAPSVDGKPLRLIFERAPPISSSSRPASSGTMPQRPVAVSRLEVALPEVGWLEDVAVGVDRASERQPLRFVHGLRHAHERTL